MKKLFIKNLFVFFGFAFLKATINNSERTENPLTFCEMTQQFEELRQSRQKIQEKLKELIKFKASINEK
jgi:hypothetical protein